MQSTDLGNKESGKIWHRKPNPAARDGIIVNIIHSTSDYLPKVSRFLNVAFDSSGDCLIAGDHQGNIYVFDLYANRFNLVQRTAQACTALAFNLRRRSEFLVALADYSIKCFDTVTKELVSWMRGHESSVFSISVHASGRYAITTSSDTAQLWDLDTFQRKRKLNIRQSVGIQKVFFLPLSNTILSCFKDNSIFAWECDTLFCKYQLPAPPESSSVLYKVFAVTRDGRILAAGGKSNHLHLWCLEAKQLFRIIQMPAKVRAIRHLEFLPDSFDAGSHQVLGVLSQDGIMRFINIQTCKLLFEIGSLDEGISSSVISPHGRYVASIMENGSLNIYSVQALTQEINKPPPPLVKVIEDLPKSKLNSSDLKMKVTSGRVRRPTKSRESKTQTRILKQDLTGNFENKENELSDGLNKKRLQILLKGYGEYPTKYRMFIWRSLLQLPENHTAFSSLVDKGVHVAFLNLQKKYPIKSRKLLRVLQRTLSALAHWSAIFSDTPYLPLLAFPFVKLFQNNQLICFEVVATLIINWCQHWFEYFPNPPINILSMIENVLAFHDKELLQHFVDHDITSQLYAWPLLETVFSEVLTREEWLKLFDNVFSNHPSFLLMAVVAYNICSRAPLLNCNLKDDFEYFFHHRNNLDITVVIREVYHLADTTPADIHPESMLDVFVALTKGQYPVFNQYPKFIVDYQTQERERIRNDELDYLRERQTVEDMQAEVDQQKAEDEAWYQKQELLRKAEETRREILFREEEKMLEQRQRLAAVKRELKRKEIHLQDAARRRFQKQQQDQREMELRRLDDEIERKVCMRDQEMATTAQDLEMRNLELESQKRLFEKKLTRNQEAAAKEMREDTDAYRRKVELEEHTFHKLLETDQAQSLKAQKLIEENLANAEQACIDADWRFQALHKQRCDAFQRNECYQEVARLLRNNRRKEIEVLNAMMGAEAEKREEAEEKEFRLRSEKRASALSDASRKWFLEQELSDALDHAKNPHCEVSLNRRKLDWDTTEQDLTEKVRNLRQRLTAQARSRCQTPHLLTT
ncbi:TBC1 domain family member 31 isoform X1 [Elephas maximus indicus]|uniref:TBC1 domain family member 31 isoform X1 n=1 Tax=Elephas maximus indicus TaxID=99487 RepID=UPI002115DDB4|nr:TBC1 domain family member 31 isoform X1 [Elephas maximus indicus]XP_049710013.1 TBC1 domain family member 31 isoform X1 [Elephas maximus indicus]